MDIIENLSKAFMGICEQRKARYSASIVTNGSLFTKTTAQRLARIKVNRVQVTLDGPPGIHDSRRPTTSGGKTFARILRNLRAASPVLPVSLRINVDHTNRGHLAAVLDIIEESGLKNTVHPYLGHTLPYSDVCRDVAGCCLSDQDFALLGLETDLELARRGFRSFRMLKPVNVYCMADMASSYAITPRGAVMKCWSEGANEEAAVGHLLEDFTERMQANMRRWQGRDPFSLECAGCILLPVCMGGCPYLYLKTGRLHCHDWKHHMNESLAIYYYLQKLRQEGDIVKRLLSVVEEVKELSVASKTGSEQE